MLQNNNKRIFSAILLSMSILIIAKGFENKIINDKSSDMNNNFGIAYQDNNKMVVDGQIVEVAKIPGYTYMGNGKYVKNDEIEFVGNSQEIDKPTNKESTQEEQKFFTKEDLINMMIDETVIMQQKGHYQSYVYCIKAGSCVRFPDGVLGIVPDGYLIYEELRETINEEVNQEVYVRSGIYHIEKKEQSRNRVKIIK